MAGRVMDSLRRFFTLEEESYSAESQDSESVSLSEYSMSAAEHPVPEVRSNRNLVGVPNTPTRKQEIVVLEPASFADAREIAETLKLKKCILLNMRKTDKELARRIVDFLSGISYAIEGQSQKVADNIYLFTPGHFDIIIPTQDQFGGNKDDVMKSGEGF
ncbi:MAG: cell division protein SepF [Candidatus Eremiobacteraeota bacterium]|nr:cell division protein SepF [Candidatus Eremiobacteraeota bacterium]